ncbi:hypothetical protein [Streptomyces sp. NPDC096095]|uniref:hypothetical protein n=1 Tax=Streptomyces sp. NPDC096095 TaxID=3155545 RepID=UPI00332F602B
MPDIMREGPYYAESSNCFGIDAYENACLAVAWQAETCLTNTREAMRTLIQNVKVGKADHLL